MSNVPMGKLEQIPKKQIFQVPLDYFDKLPLKIQSRIDTTKTGTKLPAVRYALQYGLPLILIAAILFFYMRPSPDASSILAQVETEALVDYLEHSGLTTDDLIENVYLDGAELDAIENEVYDLNLSGFTEEEIQLN